MVKGITLKKGLLKWKCSQIHVLAKKLHKNMNEEHDVPLGWHCGK
jgi:hypothetical protein